MHDRLQTLYTKRMKKLRQETVTSTRHTDQLYGLRRIWTRGLKSANKFMLGAAIAYNLKKWLNYEEQKRKTAVVSIQKTGEGLYFLFYMLQCSLAWYNAKTKIHYR